MKGDRMTEVLISPVEIRSEGGWSLFRTIGVAILIVMVALSTIRYETKITELEMRIEILETQDIISQMKTERPRQKREANPEPYTAYRSSRTQPSYQQPPQNLVRQDEDETYFTRSRDGGYVRPSGLREIWERLPPNTPERTYQSPPIDYSQTPAPQIQTRAAQPQNFQVPPVQRVGDVSARVVRFDDNDDDVMPKSSVAGHFVADVSNFTSNENPRLRNANGIFQIWNPASWMGYQRNFILDPREGVVTVETPGIYHLYAQIHYHDENIVNSFIVEVNSEPVFQCTTQRGANSCFTAGLTKLKKGDRFLIKNVGVDRFSIYKPEKSFFGLVKIGN